MSQQIHLKGHVAMNNKPEFPQAPIPFRDNNHRAVLILNISFFIFSLPFFSLKLRKVKRIKRIQVNPCLAYGLVIVHTYIYICKYSHTIHTCLLQISVRHMHAFTISTSSIHTLNIVQVLKCLGMSLKSSKSVEIVLLYIFPDSNLEQ